MLRLMIYLLGVVDAINLTVFFVVPLSLIAFSLAAIHFNDIKNNGRDDEYKHLVYKTMRKLRVIFIISLLLAVFTPSSKQLAAMYLVPKIVNNENVQQLPDKVMTVLNTKLDKWIEDMSGEKEK